MRKIGMVYLFCMVTLASTTAHGGHEALNEATMLQFPDTLSSGNPIITHIRSADPSAEVWNDGRVWIYASHDPEDAVDYSTMQDYRAYSSNDLVNWTDHGTILHARDVSWGNSANAWMFAPDAAFKDGTYYLYFPTLSADWQWRVGVATSDQPEGPFTDIGRFIEETDHIDPTCFMDNDGEAYLIWGGGGDGEGGGSGPWIARLKENMTELAETPRLIDYGAQNFGEGGYMHRRDSIYYFSWTCNTCWPYQGYYAMADNPYGPFEYKGELKRIPPGAQDHHSMVEYHGQWYYFYHVGNYGPDGSAYRRNICIDSLYYLPDGTMKEVIGTTDGVAMDLVGREQGYWIPGVIEAEDFFRKDGSLVVIGEDSSSIVAGIRDGDQMEYVLNIPGSGMYELNIRARNPLPGTGVGVVVNDAPVDTLMMDPESLMLRDSVYLHGGKHLLKLVFFHPDTAADLLGFDYMELTSQAEYFSIMSVATGGGTLSPEGLSWYARGDSAVFMVQPDPDHVLGEVLLDGVRQLPGSTYVFRDISLNHAIEVTFTPCNEITYTPYYLINDFDTVSGTNITATEGDSILIWLETADNYGISWTGPEGFTGEHAEIAFRDAGFTNSGAYVATLVNDQGCISEIQIDLQIQFAELDVFEAEDFFSQSGTRLQQSDDRGGGWFLGAIEDNDWAYYRVELDQSGFYDLTARVASESEGGYIEISDADSILAEIGVSSVLSGGWQEWYTTDPVEIPLDSGFQRLKFTFTGGGGTLFNFNWFDLEFNRPFDKDTVSATVPILPILKEPVIKGHTLEFELSAPAEIELKLVNSSGVLLRSLVPADRWSEGDYRVNLNELVEAQGGLAGGLYLVWFRCNTSVYVKKILVF